MEDWNMLGADCVVISCCCQCLMLQILVFVLIKLPCKVVRKTREYAKRKLRKGRRNDREIMGSSYKHVLLRMHQQSMTTTQALNKDDGFGHNCGCCLDEVEKVMEEFYEKGEFGFGSFWARKDVPTLDHSFVKYQIVDLVGTLSFA
ncbi:hypothetical protein Lal_00038655 [Lupinus albus]|uniref:Uncharacterized protein n=1 Tax=Lupinus albus TaxID=3870 RepID=A0A6A4NYJ8_LUPAL|nr:hypothetical protein Lalb_Chr20g0122411 [Lupinus albus]KAF1882012.1 hypothetical protein Lal_00038655 [Lupinus albus]